jgi:hypothetical protein
MKPNSDDTFRNWLVRRIAHFDDLAAGSGGTMERCIEVREAIAILSRYVAMKAAAARDDAGAANHAGTADAPRTDDPDDEAAYFDALLEIYTDRVQDIIWRIASGGTDADKPGIAMAAAEIAALPKPVKGGEA